MHSVALVANYEVQKSVLDRLALTVYHFLTRYEVLCVFSATWADQLSYSIHNIFCFKVGMTVLQESKYYSCTGAQM